MTAGQPTSPRGALLAFADYLSEHDSIFAASIYAELAREFAGTLPGEPGGELLTWSTPALDVDQQLRSNALTCAAMVNAEHQGGRIGSNVVLSDARKFEAYLRGGL